MSLGFLRGQRCNGRPWRSGESRPSRPPRIDGRATGESVYNVAAKSQCAVSEKLLSGEQLHYTIHAATFMFFQYSAYKCLTSPFVKIPFFISFIILEVYQLLFDTRILISCVNQRNSVYKKKSIEIFNL